MGVTLGERELGSDGEPVPPAGGRRRRWLALPTLVGAVVGLACVIFVAAALTSQWSEVRDEVADASLGWLAAGLGFAAAGMGWMAWCWRDALDLLGHRPPRGRTVAWYFAGEIGKYVPGGVWTVVGRAELARRGGVPAGRSYSSVGLSLVALYLSDLVLAAALVPIGLAGLSGGGDSGSPAALALLLILPLGLAALHPRVLERGRGLLVRFTGRGTDLPVPAWGATVGLVLRYLPAWILIWLSTWCVARALLPDPSLLRVGIAATLSWAAGFVAVPVPAGAGVREAVFVAAAGMPAGVAATVAVASRLLFLLVDVGGAVVTAPLHRRRSTPDFPPARDS